MRARINEITITGFKNRFNTMNIKFTDNNVSVIYGDNGCGKTTLLHIIHAILTRDDSELARNQIENVRVSYSVLDKNNNLLNRKIIIKRIKQTEQYRWPNSHLDELTSLGLGVGRIVNSPSDVNISGSEVYRFMAMRRKDFNCIKKDATPEELFDFSENFVKYMKRFRSMTALRKVDLKKFESNNLYLKQVKIEEVIQMLLENYRVARIKSSERIQNALFETLSSLVFNKVPERKPSLEEQNTLYEQILDNKIRIIKALEQRDDANLTKQEIINKLKSIVDRESFSDVINSPVLFKLFESMVEELSVERLLINAITEIVYVFNSHLPDNKHLVVDEDRVEIFVSEDSHPITELSSGETQLLITLCLLVLKGRNKNIILIDEPELSFNIKWQRKFISLVTSLVPEAQIIVASHSPAIAGSSQYKTKMNIDLAGAL
ncbi:AAA family ATPase [Vibrio splendidus]|uniref:AAA family ATPase n=1 Tax=Vibrio splendidus TaxID=29497 RepID=UPI00246896D8|nr:AAA family ATPase [Vibrio splendidus]